MQRLYVESPALIFTRFGAGLSLITSNRSTCCCRNFVVNVFDGNMNRGILHLLRLRVHQEETVALPHGDLVAICALQSKAFIWVCRALLAALSVA